MSANHEHFSMHVSDSTLVAESTSCCLGANTLPANFPGERQWGCLRPAVRGHRLWCFEAPTAILLPSFARNQTWAPQDIKLAYLCTHTKID